MVQMDQFTPYDHAQEHQAPAYGTMNDFGSRPVAAKSKAVEFERASSNVKYRRLDMVKVAEKSLFLLFWPAFLGVCVMAAYGLGYWHYAWVGKLAFALSMIVGLTMITIGLNGGMTHRASMTFMTVNGFCIMFMATTGLLLGLFCFQSYTRSYEIYRGSRTYENIVPSANPGANRDAGVIDFVAGSYVDVAHSIGMRNGDTYCAAPIVSPQDTTHSGFWAVGLNCCHSRGKFRCGDNLGRVGSGIVVLDENGPFGAEEIPEYQKVAEEAAAQFTIGMPSKPMFVRLSGDVATDQAQYFRDALSFLYSATAGMFVFMLVIAMTFSLLAGSTGFANNFYSVEVSDYEFDHPRRGKRSKKANSTAGFMQIP